MKHSSIHHFIALAFIAISSGLFLSSWMSSRIEEYLVLFLIFSIASIILGYIRPYLPLGIRWFNLIAIFVTVCIVTDGGDVGGSWLIVLLCLFTWSVSIRRFVMQKTGNTIVASKSVMRALYDLLDDTYRNIASAMDKYFKTDIFTTMVPVTHAAAIMSFSLFFLIAGMCSYESRFEEYGYTVYSGMVVLIPLLYIIRNIRHGHGFLSSILAAFVMFLIGAMAMIMCLMIAVFSIIAINATITAISNLFRKLFGD